jgi:hypothetical protein
MLRGSRASIVALCAVALLAIAVAGCGGGSSSRTTRVNHDPAQAILQQLGLQECHSKVIPSTAFINPNSSSGAGDFAGAREFVAAPDCSKKASPRSTITAATFTTHEAIAAAKATLRKQYPQSGIASFRTVVVDVIGPNAQATADKIVKLLSAGVIQKS